MAMGLRSENAGELEEEAVVAEINITPLTDIFLVLLIIFMVTSSAMVDHETSARAGVKVTLPKSNAAGPVTQKKSDPILTITKEGQVYVGTKKIDDVANRLGPELRAALQAAQSETVLVRGDAKANLGQAVDIMTIAKQAGATHISILTAAQGAGGP